MKLAPFASFARPLALLAALAIGPGGALAASPDVAAAIKTLEAIPADTEKFAAYCNVLGEMEAASDDEATYDALEDKLDAAVDAFGPEVAAAWEKISQVDSETDDGKAVTAAFETIEGKCP